MKIQLLRTVTTLLFVATIFSACQKSDSLKLPHGAPATIQNRNLKIMLTGGVADAQSVMIDLQKVEVKEANLNGNLSLNEILVADVNSDDAQSQSDQYGEWKTLNFQPQTIDMMSLKNGLEILLGNATLSNRAIKVRLTIGDGSYMIDNSGNQIQLPVSSPDDQMVYVTLSDEVLDMDNSPADAILHLDFDLFNSIIDNNGSQVLKPQVRAFSNSSFGEITGVLNPVGVQAKISLSDASGFTTVTQTDADGSFRFRGIKPGLSYNVTIDATGYAESSINNIEVLKGKSTDLGTFVMQ